MRAINWKRVGLGGLLAGAVINACQLAINAVVYRREWNYTSSQVAAFLVLGFLSGFFAIWLYAAILPRYGAGARTALIAGLAVWIFGSVIGAVFVIAMARLGTPALHPLLVYWICCLVQVSLGTLLGCRLYQDSPVPGR
ncbi:MAG TPA: hypothetical protein VFA33_19325 [Bryobacteraceae bacterium]|nr:hypothetical protein [Bryobacteraceae bacterium]